MAGTDGNKDDRSVGDWPVISENHWYSLAIVSALLTAVAIIAAFAWIFSDGFDGEADQRLAQTLAPFGVALFAVVTFCTAGWRGSINTRQANQSENEGRAKLLQEGAKLLADSEKPAHVSAGITTLGVLVSGSDREYAFQAMNLLADFVEDHMSKDHSNRHRPQISGVMRMGDHNGINTGREITFDKTVEAALDDVYYDDDEPTFWHYIPGFKSINFRGGIFGEDVHYNLNDLPRVMFRNTEIRDWSGLDVDFRFYRCSFKRCDIASVFSMVSMMATADFEWAFERCDFSGCKLHDVGFLRAKLKTNENYFVAGNPPILIGRDIPVDWEALLERKEKKPDWWAF